MPEFDLVIRGGLVVTQSQVEPLELGISGGKITALAPTVSGSVRAELNATGQHILAGVIDAHVHFNEPGRTDWEGLATGSRALAAGGATIFFDMPLNAHPPTIDAASFALKLAAAQASSVVDFALWGGLVPTNVEQMAELAECGVIPFKAFMSNSGIEDFASVDDAVLRRGMTEAARLKKLVAVHAESDTLTRDLAAASMSAGKISIRDYLASRPVVAELEAIRRAIRLAEETGCALHVVHVSSGAGVALIAEAQKNGVDVTCETCPHYLVLTEEDVVRLGAVAKCAPPLRSTLVQEELWQAVLLGDVTTIGSDHSPAPPSMKTDTNFFKVWGGISGAQHTLPLLITEGHLKRHLSLPSLTRLLSGNIARRFNLPKTKAGLQLGADADLALVDLNAEFTIAKSDLLYRHPQSPYLDQKLHGRVTQTILRGQTIYKDGKLLVTGGGQLIKPVS